MSKSIQDNPQRWAARLRAAMAEVVLAAGFSLTYPAYAETGLWLIAGGMTAMGWAMVFLAFSRR